jgi:hypothetical protein
VKNLEAFQKYQQERAELLESLAAFLAIQPDVVAAWLWGSVGSGEADALSDLDLWIVVSDESIEAIKSDPRRWVVKYGRPILTVEAQQNAPQGGAYLMAGFDAATAPHLVDWYWQPVSMAFIPDNARLLLDKAGLPRRSQAPAFTGSQKTQPDTPFQAISYFWMMLMIVAKKFIRDPQRQDLELAHLLVDALNTAQGTLRAAGRIADNALPAQNTPQQKVQLLYYFAGEMEKVMEVVQAEGEPAPAEIVPGAYRFLKMIEAGLDG